jgi:hypothetical protein
MKPLAKQLTGEAIAKFAEHKAAAGTPLEASDAVWICSALISVLQPLFLPDGTPEQSATWFADWLPEIEARVIGLSSE